VTASSVIGVVASEEGGRQREGKRKQSVLQREDIDSLRDRI